jgi:hypothetical protein
MITQTQRDGMPAVVDDELGWTMTTAFINMICSI